MRAGVVLADWAVVLPMRRTLQQRNPLTRGLVLGAVAVLPGCESHETWRAGDERCEPILGSGIRISGGWQDAAIVLAPALVILAGRELCEWAGQMGNRWRFERDAGIPWDSDEGRALRRAMAVPAP